MANPFEECSQAFGEMSSSKRCCVVSFCLAFVSIIVYVAVALEGVEPTEYALVRNNLSQDINTDKILSGGLHYVGVFYSLIHFPAIHKSLEFSDDPSAQQSELHSRTKEGLDLSIHCSFQYQLKKDELPDMYRLLQNDYESVFTRIARNAVLQVAGDYKAPEYWQKRREIGDKMRMELER